MIFILLFLASSLITYLAPETPNFKTLKEAFVSSEAILYDRSGRILQETRLVNTERKLEWIEISNVSEYFLDAVLLAEDKRFFSHSGVDWMAVGSGIFRMFTAGSLRGASTITMQLATIVDANLRAKQRWKTIPQKWNQMFAAKSMEAEWTKEEILEAYINLVSYRGELVGIHSASRGLFGKDPHGLTAQEGIILASMIKTPSGTKDRIKDRACHLQSLLLKNNDCEDLFGLIETTLSKPYRIQPTHKNAKHVADRLLEKNKRGFFSTLDKELQIFSREALRKQLLVLRENHVFDGAVLVKKNDSNEILAYIANPGELSSASEMDGVQAKRQSGSTLKPFLYALAFEKKLLTPLSLLDDSPAEIQVGTGIYNPTNYQSNYNGMVTAKVALASSLNIPAIHVLETVGTDDFVNLLEKFGFSDLQRPDHYGLSIALGSLDVSLWELVNAYSVFPKRGIFSPQTLVLQTPRDTNLVISPETSFLVSHILGDRDARALTFGLESPLSTRYPSSVKTGTSKDMRDNWCIGFSSTYTVGVWVGNFNGDPMWNVSGITGAAPIWAEIMDYLHKDLLIAEEIPPQNIIEKIITNANGSITSKEYFLKGTETNTIPEPSLSTINGIVSPTKDSVIALDPDIPPERQKVFFEPRKFSKDLDWVLNEKKLGSASEILLWSPLKGEHTLELFGKSKAIDKIKFIVK
jgi:penicillin-binding protein 1C